MGTKMGSSYANLFVGFIEHQFFGEYFHSQSRENAGTSEVHQDHCSFQMLLGQCHLLYNLCLLQKVLHW